MFLLITDGFQGTDTALIMKCNKNYEKNPFYLKAKSDIALKFGIRHYAGIVIYSVDGKYFKFLTYN